MKTVLSFGMLLAAVASPLASQTHKVAKPESVVRAIGVYEWTGDLAKPTASRLIPISLFIDKHLEDAGVYLARPVPFALQSGFVYELDEAGVPRGNLELAYARHLQAASSAQSYDDGWFGYGNFKALAVPKKTVARKLPPARTTGIETASSANSDKPHLGNKTGQAGAAASTEADQAKADQAKGDRAKKEDAPAADPDRPHLSKKDDATADSRSDSKSDVKPDAKSDPETIKDDADTGGNTPAGDPERPTMKRRSGTTPTPDASATRSSGSAPEDDPDRPTLKRRSSDDAKDAKKKARDESASTVTAIGSLNDDPDRPNLHRGKPTSAMTEAELPKLAGLPADLRQMVAVSDAVNRPAHDFTRPWEDDAERLAVLGKMQAMAQVQLAAYGAGKPAAPVAPLSATPSTAARPSSKRRAVSPVRTATVALLDEQLKGYLLSYGDVPTFVYQAHTGGTGVDLRYVTLVAQRDAQGEPKRVLNVVTDAAHLDRTARMRLVDAVDVEASNRASLLFEMRGQTSRQFGVYRILGQQAEQIFSTGTMQ